MSHQQNETRSTAYVFGELSKEEATQFEQELGQSTELRREVASIREAVVALEAEFDSQATGVNTAGREKIQQAMSSATASPGVSNSTELNKSESGISHRRLIIGLAIAASLLVIVGLVYPRLPGLRGQNELVLSQAKDHFVRSQAPDAMELEEEYAEFGNAEGDSAAARPRRSVAEMTRQSVRVKPVDSAGEPMATGKRVSEYVVVKDEAEPMPTAPTADASYGDVASGPDPVRLASPAGSPEPASSLSVPAEAEVESKSRMSKLAKAPGKEEAAPNHPFPPTAGPSAASPRADSPAQTVQQRRFEQQAVATAAIESRRQAVNALSSSERQQQELERVSPGFDADKGIGPGEGGDRHDVIEDNPFMEVESEPLSTFSIDVDTAAYAKVRMYLMQQNSMPRPDAVRIEELVNYFTYDYAPPEDDHPFSAAMEVAACPWNAKHRLARIGIKGKVIDNDRPASNLVFLLDVSGSMNRPNKLPLVVEGMKMLVDQLTENDSVAIVVYAGAAGLVLDSTTGDRKQTIIESLERLRAGGSTNGGQGITLAYQMARDNFITGGTNRVILCSDGDFNVGVTGTDELVRIAEENAKSNIFLSVLGFGMGNHNDSMMEQISNKGNGNYAFIDSKAEAQKVLVEEMGATLVTIAKDVKIQVEFNPKEVSAYRLIGYENRMLAAQDFNDDKKDAGEIGAGHTVTALYELVPAGVESDVTIPAVDDLKYQKKTKTSPDADSGELLTLKLRYKQPEGTKSRLIEFPVTDSGRSFTKADPDFQFAASVAAFGMLLRNSPYKGDATYAAVEEIANGGISNDPGGYRSEFLQMVARAKQLSGE